jgi:hypothetical protein
MRNTFFTADTHFNHANIISFCQRPFAAVAEMNEALIAKTEKGTVIFSPNPRIQPRISSSPVGKGRGLSIVLHILDGLFYDPTNSL